jgi:hypothetical protein
VLKPFGKRIQVKRLKRADACFEETLSILFSRFLVDCRTRDLLVSLLTNTFSEDLDIRHGGNSSTMMSHSKCSALVAGQRQQPHCALETQRQIQTPLTARILRDQIH